MSPGPPDRSTASAAVPALARSSSTARFRRGMAAAMLAVLLASVAFWYVSRDRLPATIRIATSPEGGLYQRVGQSLKLTLEQKFERPVVLIPTAGSVENRRKLIAGEADLAFIQDGTVDPQGLVVVAPLYHDVVHVVVRRDRGIDSIEDCEGKNVALGHPESGMRHSAQVVLKHYGIEAEHLGQNERYFKDLLTDPTLDAAIVTTGFLNHDLREVVAKGKFELLPIRDAESLVIHHPYLSMRTIPTGVFEGHPPVPHVPVPSVSTTAYLGARADVSPELVRRTLVALYEHDLRRDIPTLIPLNEARQTPLANLHPATRTYYDPFGGVELLSNLLESISAAKELAFALAAGLYLAWDRWRRVKEREERRAIEAMKERLDRFLEETVKLEKAQMETDDPRKLREYLDGVTRIKLRAIEELTHEALRGDRMFSIFLLQCGDLAVKIQAKLHYADDVSRQI